MEESDHIPTLREIQESVDDWIGQWEEGYWGPLSNLARLSEEVGELARVLNHVYGEKRAKDDEGIGDVGLELGDVLFVVITIANSLDIDLTESLARVMKKYDIRDAERWTKKEKG